MEPTSFMPLVLAGEFFTIELPGKPHLTSNPTPNLLDKTHHFNKAILTLIKFNMDTILYVTYVLYSNFPSSPSKYLLAVFFFLPFLPPPTFPIFFFLIQDLIQDDTLHLVISLRRL